jgi:predicted enzyme related to lactoylglutathione lyase
LNVLVNLDVDDLEKAVSFYTSAFGLRVGRRFGADGAELLGAAVPIYLLPKAPGTPATTAGNPRSYDRHWTPLHFDFVVEDIDRALEKALAAGARLEDPVTAHAYGKLAMLSDPFGHGFCLLQFTGRGYDEIAD